MAPRIGMLLGRSLWVQEASGWRRERARSVADALSRLSELLAAASSEDAVLVFEPEGLVHEPAETPRVGRSVFCKLERIRTEHPVVESENLGWGLEPPEPVPGGGYSTLVHSEPTPGLVHLREACAGPRSELVSAWSAFTVAAAFLRASSPRARFALILADNFAAVAACGRGRRAFKAWTGPLSERDWLSLATSLGEVDGRPAPSKPDADSRRSPVAVIADGDPAVLCPLWADLQASGRVSSVSTLESLAAAVLQIPFSHPANLVEAFPKARSLDLYLLATGLTGFAAAVALAASSVSERNALRADESASGVRARGMEERLVHLEANKVQMQRMASQIPDSPASSPRRHASLVGLADAIPDSLTLTSLVIGPDGAFALEGLCVGTDFDAERVRKSLEAKGFVPADHGGWTYEGASGRLLVRGRLTEARP